MENEVITAETERLFLRKYKTENLSGLERYIYF